MQSNSNKIYKVLINKNNAISSFKFLKKHLLIYLIFFVVLTISLVLVMSLYTYFYISMNLSSDSMLFPLIYVFIVFVWFFAYLILIVLVGLRINSMIDTDQSVKIFYKNRSVKWSKLPWVVFKDIKKIEKIIELIESGKNPLDVIYKVSYFD